MIGPEEGPTSRYSIGFIFRFE